MNQLVYNKLKEVAHNQGLITYTDVGSLVKLEMENPAHRNELSAILGDISSTENNSGRPMLSAIVVLAETNMPGEGFYKLARHLGLYSDEDDLTIFQAEVKKVHDVWNKQDQE